MSKITNISNMVKRRFTPTEEPTIVKIPNDYAMVIIRGMAKQASILAYDEEKALEMPYEELTVGELLSFMKENYEGMMLELIRTDL